MAVHVQKGVRRQLRKRVALQTGTGFTTEPDGYEVADIEVFVDLAQIGRALGTRAMENKSGRCRYMEGAVLVSVLNRKREAP